MGLHEIKKLLYRKGIISIVSIQHIEWEKNACWLYFRQKVSHLE